MRRLPTAVPALLLTAPTFGQTLRVATDKASYGCGETPRIGASTDGTRLTFETLKVAEAAGA